MLREQKATHLRRMKLASREAEHGAQATITVHAEHLDIHAAVAFALPAGNAVPTVHVRLNRALLPRLHVLDPSAN